MPTYQFDSLKDFAQQIRKDMKARDKRMATAVHKAARRTARYVALNTVPKAFGELAASLHVEDIGVGRSDVVADAPHAAAVENGSRPHWMPIEPLLKWVKLRGMQGLTKSGRTITARAVAKDWRKEGDRAIALAIKGKGTARATPVDAAMEVARAIQAAIAKRGTKPTHFMALGIPVAEQHLAILAARAVADGESEAEG
jgi:hypothetical protein